MKVLRHGNNFYTRICKDCGCKFLFTKTEISHNQTVSDDFAFITEYDTIDCPECGTHIILDGRTIEI